MIRFRNVTIFTIVLSTILFIAGCEEFLQTGDRIAQGIRDVNQPGQEFLQTPTGGMIPVEVGVAIGGLASIAAAYQEWRRRIMAKTTKAIVQGIEKVHKNQNPDEVSQVKASIEAEMKDAHIYDRANKIVDKAKVG